MRKTKQSPKSLFDSAKASVKAMCKNIYVSESAVRAAFYRVRRELKAMGLLWPQSPLDKTQCHHEGPLTLSGLSGFGGVMGFYSFEDHDIHVPAFWPAALLPWYKGRCMTDVLRHEFGHALADAYPQYFHCKHFADAFGRSYGRWKVAEDGDEGNYVSAYARTYTQEDFAETFMLYVKYKGVLPQEFARNEAIRAKWEEVEYICNIFGG